MENHHFEWVNPLFLWPFSIAKCKRLPEGIYMFIYVSPHIHHSIIILQYIHDVYGYLMISPCLYQRYLHDISMISGHFSGDPWWVHPSAALPLSSQRYWNICTPVDTSAGPRPRSRCDGSKVAEPRFVLECEETQRNVVSIRPMIYVYICVYIVYIYIYIVIWSFT